MYMNRLGICAIVFATAMTMASCSDDPTSLNNLPRGAFAGMNTGLLSTLITNTTNVGGDTAAGVLTAGRISASRFSGEAPERSYFRALALFSIGGVASAINSVHANAAPLVYLPNSPPAHYRLDTAASDILGSGRSISWNTVWPSGANVGGNATLPPDFGTVTLSVGRQMSVAALDAGQAVTVSWTGVVPQTIVFIYASWQPKVYAPTLVGPPLAVLVAEDEGSVTIPGSNLAQRVKQPNGQLTFVLYRGTYENIASFDDNTKALAAFSYIADSVRVELID